MIELIIYGTILIVHIVRSWNKPEKKSYRVNEMLYGLLYYLIAFLSLNLFTPEHLTEPLENLLYMILFFTLISFDLFWWLINFIPNIIYCKRNPTAVREREYSQFIKDFFTPKSEDLTKDLSRKLLHIILLSIVIGLYLLAQLNQSSIEKIFENYWAFCKLIYYILALIFCNMISLADTVRTTKFHWIPCWARKWYSTSLGKNELNTVISALPYVLTLLLFINAPIQVIFVAATISALGDGAASIIGKRYGKHHFPPRCNQKKTFEGLFAGILMTFLSTMLILCYFPNPTLTYYDIILIGILNIIAFTLIDMFIERVSDNILNVLIPGLITWAFIII